MENTLIVGGTIHVDGVGASVDALGVVDGHVAAAGTRAHVERRLGPASRVVNLQGRTVIPGLVESHVHPIFFGLTRGWVDCRSPIRGSVDDILAALTTELSTLRPGAWLRGWGYDDTLLAEYRHPTRQDLDRVSTDIPVVISHISGHFAVANSVALKIAGIHAGTPDPAEGRFVRDASGEPTGLMWEIGAVNRVLSCIPPPTAAALEDAAQYALATAASRGMTSIHDLGIGLMAGLDEVAAWRSLADAGKIPLRVEGYIRGDLLDALLAEGPGAFAQKGMFRLHGAKFWSDGSIQGLSAAVLQPYSCAEESCGDLLFSQDELVDLIRKVEACGGQCAVHANGDRAIETVIESFRQVLASGGNPTARHRVEHLQMASPEHLRLLTEAGGAASIFANHVYYWGDRHRDVFLGEQRSQRLNPLADAARQGLHFGLHSDCPITPMDPLKTLWTAVTRQTSAGAVLGPEQKLTAAQALHALTADSAWLVHRESERGTLHEGQLADLAVLDTDILSVSEEDLEDVQVHGTMVGGQWIHGDYADGPPGATQSGDPHR